MKSPSSIMDTIKEDIWIKTTCMICFNNCAIRVHRVNGVVVGIEGNPDCPTSRGGICPRGASGIMMLYDPNRVNVPLKRTNPKKGIGVDPGWVEISWDEALNIITDKLRKIKAEDPRKLLIGGTVILNAGPYSIHRAFGEAFESPNVFFSGAGLHCGCGAHLVAGLMYCAWTRMPDPNYIEYYLNFGCPSGFGAYYSLSGMAQRMAAARRRGMKHVAIEPWMGMPGVNSDEWVPIRPGTDAAMALAMVNLLLNEYGIYDVPNIKEHTNGPYLVGSDGYYVRDKKTQKPLMWDTVDKKAKTYDDPTVNDVAIEGSYQVDGVLARPAFALIKEHVKKYTPELASQITSAPVETIRRLAREFGEAAKIGSTIVVDGKELPYRPVVVGYFKGAQAHRHSALTCIALDLLQEIVGARNVPGGCLGMSSRCFGYPETGQPYYSPGTGPDGLLQAGYWVHKHPPWPTGDAKKPQLLSLGDLVPTASGTPLVPWVITEPEKYQIPYKPEFMLQMGGNHLMCYVDPRTWEKAMQEGIFTAAFSLYLDESTEFADIVLPDACYLERLDVRADWQSSLSPVDEWSWHLRQPVVAPMFQRRPAQEVLLELAERLGIRADMYRAMNETLNFKEPYLLDPAKKYTWDEIVDRAMKGYFGPERGLAWFKENGLIHWPKKVEEVYWRPFIKARAPIYLEHFKRVGEQIDKIRRQYNLPCFEDTSDFQPIPDWKPCASYTEKRPEFDMYAVYYRIPFQTFTSTYNNPWLDEVSKTDPYVYRIAINTATAQEKGIKDGDWVLVESAGTGNKIKGKAILTEGVHHEVIAYCSGGGHWSKNLPIASQEGKGVCPEWLIPLSWDQMDAVSGNLDLCVKVKVTKKN